MELFQQFNDPLVFVAVALVCLVGVFMLLSILVGFWLRGKTSVMTYGEAQGPRPPAKGFDPGPTDPEEFSELDDACTSVGDHLKELDLS